MMGSSRRLDDAHRAEVLKRQRALAPELFREHTEAEQGEIAAALDRLDQGRTARRLAAALPDPQAQLPLEVRP